MSLKVRDVVRDADAHFSQGHLTLKTPAGTVTWQARHLGGPQWVLTREDGASHVALVAKDRTGTWVHVDGRAWLVQRAEGRAAGAGASDGTVAAPMTGKILEVLVAKGDEVTDGQPLLVLSAMKMRLEIKAPRAGVVKRLSAETGAQVEGGALLAEIGPA